MIEYKTKATLDSLLNPNYCGYLSYYAKNNNLPENYMVDFPTYANRKINYYTIKPAKIEWPAEHVILRPELMIYEKIVLNRRYNTFRCDEADMLKISIPTVICNIKKRGSCLLAYEFCDLLHDYVYLLKACFATVYVHAGYIKCENFMLDSKNIERVLNYFRYAIDCPGDICPFKLVDPKLENLFKALIAG